MGLGIGPLELGMIFLVALIVFGPNRLPEIVRTVGRTIGEFRRAINQVTLDLTEESRRIAPPPASRPVQIPRVESDQPLLPPTGTEPRDQGS